MVGENPDFGHKYSKGLGKRTSHPQPIFPGALPSPKA